VEKTPAFTFLGKDPATRSNTGVCLVFGDPSVAAQSADARWTLAKEIVALIEKEGAGFDFGAYRDAPPGLRIWCGATVETSDVAALTRWIDWAYAEARTQMAEAA
jgi:phosphoserine aminotransferase